MKKILLISLLSLTFSVATNAQGRTMRADRREATQRARIREGRKEGEITKAEGAALNGEQRRVKRSERRAKADGTVTPKEKMKIEKKQDRASRHIRRAKRNPIDNN